LKKFGEYLEESLAAEVKSEPKTAASIEARKLGLTYMGFGRYANSKGQITYIVHNDRLVPYKTQEDVQGMYQKVHQTPSTVSTKSLEAQADKHNKILTKRSAEDEKIANRKMKEAIKTNKILTKAFPASMFDENEMAALQEYTNQGFGPVNRYLYKGLDDDATQEDADYINGVIEGMDSAFSNSQAPMNYTVYTGLSQRYTSDKFVPGKDYIFKGYVSTTLDYNTAIELFTEQNEDSVILQIEVSKGQNAIHVSGFSNVNADEDEFLQTEEMETILPRGSKIKIISGPHVIMTDAINKDRYGGEWSVNIFHCQLIEDV
jgi:hypothetical protein